jgi:mannose-6-phosphate isomerase-like protein (cupin superfamily)
VCEAGEVEEGTAVARSGDVIENPVSGERIAFLKTASETGGELLRFVYEAPPHAPGPPLHVHPRQEERFVEVISGTLVGRLGSEERVVGRGEGFAVPPGTPHTWRNAGDEAVRMLVEIRPALRMEEVFEVTFDLARRGKTDVRGVPKNPLQAAATAREYADELRLARPPFAVQKVLLGLLAPVCRLLGYEGRGRS